MNPLANPSADRLDVEAIPRVLVVDDNAANLAAFASVLSETDFEVVNAQSGVEAMKHLLAGDFAAILLDINMPDLDGIQTARLIRQRERSRDIPIIFITAYQPDQAQILKGYASGAVDYLIKPVSPEILRSKVRIFVDLFRKTRQIEWQARQLRAVNHKLQREIEQRELAERDAAFEREERQRVALASIADAVLTTDANGYVVSLNPVAEQLACVSAARAKGLPLREVLCGLRSEDAQLLDQMLERSLSHGERLRAAAPAEWAVQDGKRRYLDYSAAPICDRVGQTVGAALIVQDITGRHEAALERAHALQLEQEARQAAERANRARDDFLAVISHELRTPLNAIVGWTHVLRTLRADSDHAAQALDAIHRSAMAQKKLIEDLLDMSRIINGKVELSLVPVDLAVVASSVVEMVQPLAREKGIGLECVIDTTVGQVVADRMRIEQVIWNVLTNAVKFTPAGGQVEVCLKELSGAAILVVSDTGQGICAEFLGNVFEAFRQADSTTTRKQGGLGLGLAIAKQLLSMHGGAIAAHSAGPDQGSRFTITLPLTSPHELAGYAAAGGTRGSEHDTSLPYDDRLRDLQVLVVDDDINTLDLVRIVLTRCGAEVRTARTANDGLALLNEWRPDVLLSDISMPDQDGYAFVRALRALPPDQGGGIPAAALTAMVSDEDRARALTAGFQTHVPKPLEPAVLVRTVAGLAQR